MRQLQIGVLVWFPVTNRMAAISVQSFLLDFDWNALMFSHCWYVSNTSMQFVLEYSLLASPKSFYRQILGDEA